MLDNKYTLIVALVLFLGGAGYNIWYFFLQGDGNGGGGQVVGGGSPEPAAQTAGGTDAAPPTAAESQPSDSVLAGLDALVRAARDGRLPVRPAPEFERVLAAASNQPAWGRDPLRLPQPEPQQPTQPQQPAVRPPAWKLGAVMTGGDRNAAVINGQVYAEGESIDGGTIVSIASNRVVIRWRGRNVVLEPQ